MVSGPTCLGLSFSILDLGLEVEQALLVHCECPKGLTGPKAIPSVSEIISVGIDGDGLRLLRKDMCRSF